MEPPLGQNRVKGVARVTPICFLFFVFFFLLLLLKKNRCTKTVSFWVGVSVIIFGIFEISSGLCKGIIVIKIQII
jgi:hypothetical protein